MTQIAPFQYTVSAGGRIMIPHPGTWVTVTKGDYPFEVSTDKGSKAQLENGLGVELEPFERLFIFNSADYAQTIQVYIGDAYVRDSRLSVPSDTVVGVTDGEKQIVQDGKCFSYGDSLGANATNYNHHQLWNPSGSGYNVFVYEYELTNLTADSSFIVGFYNTNLSLLRSDPYSTNSGGDRDTIIEVRSQHVSSAAAVNNLRVYFNELNKPFIKNLVKPLMLPPGWGLTLINSAVNQQTRVGMEYVRELI